MEDARRWGEGERLRSVTELAKGSAATARKEELKSKPEAKQSPTVLAAWAEFIARHVHKRKLQTQKSYRSPENYILRVLGAVPLDQVDAGCFEKIGERAGLQWKDIKSSSMWICRNVTTGVLQDSTKSGEDAEVPLTPRLVQALQALKMEDLDRTWVLPRRTKREPEPGGTHSDDRYLPRIVTTLEADAGLPAHGPPRIRHSRLTHLAEKGLPLRALQHLARHANEETPRGTTSTWTRWRWRRWRWTRSPP
ncbi:Phage integrase family protein [Nannocystis exedens]|uniref:Phage integrase family protein n=2 Tax=Nannocystis exedens TaxID=54 RepID=A0A1I2EYS3_9BACT|nr:Tyrosine recombinase XerC [Nannocystis exedens]SFE97598.1 Phage integrase family protein [Nannocystis exedens]